MSRPVDDNVEFSPRDIILIDSVGDEHATYDELKTTHRYMLGVSRKNFVDFGSDIGTFIINMINWVVQEKFFHRILIMKQ